MSNKVTKSAVIALALEEVGYLGKKNQTDDVSVKEAPNGVGTYNKYSRALADTPDGQYYNFKKDGAPWCAIFVDWLFYTASGNDKAKATSVKPLAGGGCGAGVKYAHNAYKSSALSENPQVGAQIFYKDNDGFAHTGLVVAVDGDDITTVEGNWDNQVSKRVVRLDEYYGGQYIYDFAMPDYDAEEEETTDDTVTITKEEYNRTQKLLAEYSVKAAELEEENAILETKLEKQAETIAEIKELLAALS